MTVALDLPTPLAARRGFVTLDAEAWAQIRSEYLAGATGKQISQKWGCSRVAVYDHASKGGWTKRARGQAVSATVLEEVRAEREAVAARALRPAPQADPVATSRLLARRAAASALEGRDQQAFEEVRMAESLARCASLVTAREPWLLTLPPVTGEAPPEAAEDEGEDEAEVPILERMALAQLAHGRTPPQRLPLWFVLDGHEALRPLAEALGLVVEGQAGVECADFEAAVDAAYAQGRGEAVERALREPTPLEHCAWLDEAGKAEVAAQEARAVRLAGDAGMATTWMGLSR